MIGIPIVTERRCRNCKSGHEVPDSPWGWECWRWPPSATFFANGKNRDGSPKIHTHVAHTPVQAEWSCDEFKQRIETPVQ